jgi:N-acetylneuraminic acid mutarotase
VATLEAGEIVEVIQIKAGWAQVEYGDVIGWARSKDLINVNVPMPFPRASHQLVYDNKSDRFILFGGRPNLLNDTWAYDANANVWTYREPANSPPGGEGPMAYDSQSDRIILFVGRIGDPPFKDIPSETWAYDYNTNTWTNMKPEITPPLSLAPRMVYDSESDRMILFGGNDALRYPDLYYLNQTWAYDFDSNTWEKMEPELSPLGRNGFAMAYDEESDRAIIFGGDTEFKDPIPTSHDVTADTWAYDYNTDTWEAMKPAEAPLPRSFDRSIYRGVSDQIILFGGVNELAQTSFGDTWAYNYNTDTWTELKPAASPPSYGWYGMAYSTKADKIIMFGGGPAREDQTLDLWIYDPKANTWTKSN